MTETTNKEMIVHYDQYCKTDHIIFRATQI